MTRELRMFLAKIESIGLPAWGVGAGANDKAFRRIKRMLQEHGQVAPIIVRDAVEPEDAAIVYEVIDGEKRLAAAADLGWTEIYVCHVPDVDDMTAREIGISIVAARGNADREALADTLADLQEAYGGDAEKIAALGRRLPFHSRNMHKLISRLRGTNREPDVERRKSKVTYRFKVLPDAADTIDRAVDKIVVDNDATRDQALEYLAADFLAGAPGVSETGAARVKRSVERLREQGVKVPEGDDDEPFADEPDDEPDDDARSATGNDSGGNDGAPAPERGGAVGSDGVLAGLGLGLTISIDGLGVDEVHELLVEAVPSMNKAREILAHLTGGAVKSRDRRAILRSVAKRLVESGAAS